MFGNSKIEENSSRIEVQFNSFSIYYRLKFWEFLMNKLINFKILDKLSVFILNIFYLLLHSILFNTLLLLLLFNK